MNLKNYTSTVPALTSIGKIQRVLVEAGATDISQKYDPVTKICIAISFRIKYKDTAMFFQLPAKVSACYEVLFKEVKRPQPDTKKRVFEQAERTAWKIVSDWVEIQLAMIQMEQAEMMQVFLPYAYNPATDTTFYDKMKSSEFKALNYKHE